MTFSDVPHKANQLVHLILIAFLMIVIRVWYLSSFKHDEYMEKALLPQRRTVLDPALRGTIHDRFNIPFAINTLQYNATICYDRIREIPVVSWISKRGKKLKIYERKLYIENLSQMLGRELGMDPIEIEDLIYSKASIFPNTPFILKEDVSEKLYYQLRFKEKDWTGLHMQKACKRYYPQGKVGSDIIGYIGAINETQYLEIAHEIQDLNNFLKQYNEGLPTPLPKGYLSINDIEKRVIELKEKAYTIHTYVGKSGIERQFDESLRGIYGKKLIETGAKGRFISNLPGSKKPISGNRILLTISSELQAYCEELLIENERERDRHFKMAGKGHEEVRPPWMKGGAIVAMVPKTGEVLALASYPRFDPNDFILTDKNRSEKIHSIYKWLENPFHISQIWNGLCPIEREHLNFIENNTLTWDLYLDMVLSLNGQVRKGIKQVESVKHAVHLQHLFLALMKLLESDSESTLMNVLYREENGHIPSQSKDIYLDQIAENLKQPLAQEMRKPLDSILLPIKHNEDKLLFLDLLRLVANNKNFSSSLLEKMDTMTLSHYRLLNQSFCFIQNEVKSLVSNLYKERIFSLWRKKYFKAYLKEKRDKEKECKKYARPYTDYLAEAENKLFKEFWDQYKWKFFDAFIYGNISCKSDLQPFLFHLSMKSKELTPKLQEHFNFLKNHNINLLASFRSYHELNDSLWGQYYSIQGKILRDLAKAFYPKNGFGYGRSFAYGCSTSVGSIFKMVTGYEALKQNYLKHQDHNIPIYDLNPLTIVDEVNPNYITKQGMVLGRYLDNTLITRHYKGGRMPRTHSPLGKINFRTAMERSSNIYFSLLASEIIKCPSDLEKITYDFGFGKTTGIDLYGEIKGYVPNDIRFNTSGLYSFAIGQHSLVVTPLQTAMMLGTIGNRGSVLKPQIVKLQVTEDSVIKSKVEVKRTLHMPDRVRNELIEGMRSVVMGEKGPAQPHRIRTLYEHPKWLFDYKKLQNHFIGKTSSAEVMYHPNIDREGKPKICKDIWFGSLFFEKGNHYKLDIPDLSIVIYLRFGDYGKEAAPLAAQVIKKWKELQNKYNLNS